MLPGNSPQLRTAYSRNDDPLASRFPFSPAFRPQAALKSAKLVVDRLLDRERDNNGGKYPETIALVLWGTDNIKTFDESMAQVRPGFPCLDMGGCFCHAIACLQLVVLRRW